MNAACPRRVSLIIAGGLPAIPTPTINAPTRDRPAASGFAPAPTGFAFHSQARPATPTESSSRRTAHRPPCVSDWSFSFRCSPPRLAATQLRFDTARLFTAQERTSTAPSSRLLRRTRADISVRLGSDRCRRRGQECPRSNQRFRERVLRPAIKLPQLAPGRHSLFGLPEVSAMPISAAQHFPIFRELMIFGNPENAYIGGQR